MLVILTLFADLTGVGGTRDATAQALRDALPAPLADALLAPGGEWDAPLQGGPLPVPPLPGPEVLDLRQRRGALGPPSPAGRAPPAPAAREADLPGSNGWAVDGRRSATGAALVANDMHLGLSVPNIWYRASLAWSEGGVERQVTGVTLPGLPAVVAGSNGRVAWGFTNSYGDWQDLVVLEPVDGDEAAYRTPDGPERLGRVVERILVRGAAPEALEVLESRWGPVVDRDGRGRRRALAWTALRPGAVDLGLLALERAGGVDEALALAQRAGMPPHNLMVGDAAGASAGPSPGGLPRRVGLDGTAPRAGPTAGAAGTAGWRRRRRRGWSIRRTGGSGRPTTGWSRARRWPPSATAATRSGARARQIRDDLRARERFDERDLLAIQLDDRALFLARWRGAAARDPRRGGAGADPRRAEVRRLVVAWGGRASVDSVGYRLVREWRLAVLARALEPAFALRGRGRRRRGWRPPISSRPRGWAGGWSPSGRRTSSPPRGGLAGAPPRRARRRAGGAAGGRAPPRGADLGRGQHRRHPPPARQGGARLLGGLLDMPADPQPGDAQVPRVAPPQLRRLGAVRGLAGPRGARTLPDARGPERPPALAVLPGRPRGLGPGEAAPFLPGPTRHRLVLRPEVR